MIVSYDPPGGKRGPIAAISYAMQRAILRWVMLGAGLLIAGPIVGLLMDAIPPLEGGSGLTPLISQNPLVGVLISSTCLLIAAAVGLLAARWVGFRDGLATMGVATAWACWSTGRLTDIARVVDGVPTLRLGAEGAILGLLASLLAFALVSFSRDFRDSQSGNSGFTTPGALIGLGGMILGGLVGGWVFARTPLVGQTLGAAIAGGVVGGMLARLLQPNSDVRVLILGFPIIAGGGVLLGRWLAGSGDLVAAVYSGTSSPLMSILPIDWVAGLLIGLPVGISWGGALVERHVPEKTAGGDGGLMERA